MILSEKSRLFLNQFDNTMRNHVVEYCKKLEKINSDVFIVMARKAASLICALTDLGMLSLNGIVVSERVMDMDVAWLDGKTITIVDDIIISGTTIRTLINILNSNEKIKVKSIDVAVIAVNSYWFRSSVFMREKNEKNKENESYLLPIYCSLQDSACTEFCSNVIASFFTLPRPYDMDFPLIKNFKVTEEEFKVIMRNGKWETTETTSAVQNGLGVFSLALSPMNIIFEQLNDYFGVNVCALAFCKIRVYYRYDEKNKNTYDLNFMPLLIFKGLHADEINMLFNDIVRKEDIPGEFISDESKFRFLQYFFSAKLMLFWYNQILIDLKRKRTYTFDKMTTAMLFSPKAANAVYVYCRDSENFKCQNRNIEMTSYNNINTVDEDDERQEQVPELTDSQIYENEYLPFTVLTSLFDDLYKTREIEAREAVKKDGLKVFDEKHEDHKKISTRLGIGYSFDALISIFRNCVNYDVKYIVSVFLDNAIDLGIIVPITGKRKKDNYYYRAYRHGEDVLFSKKEEAMCCAMLRKFLEISGETKLDDLVTEKLLTLFIKYCVGPEKIIPRFISKNDAIEKAKTIHGNQQYVLSIKYYIQGAVPQLNALYSNLDDNNDIEAVYNDTPFTNSYVVPNWLFNILRRKGYIDGSLLNIKKVNELTNDFRTSNMVKAELFGGIYGKVIRLTTVDENNKEKPLLDPNDFIVLSTLSTPEDTANALAAEATVFKEKWPRFLELLNNTTSENYLSLTRKLRNKKIDDIDDSENSEEKPGKFKFFEAINSGIFKIKAYYEEKYKEITDKVKDELTGIDKTTWDMVTNSDFADQVNVSSIYKTIETLSRLILHISILLLLMEKSLRYLSDEKVKLKRKNGLLSVQSLNKLEENITYSEDILRGLPNDKNTVDLLEFRKNANFTDRTTFNKVIERLNNCEKKSVSYLDDVKLMLSDYGNVHEIYRYTTVVYFETDDTRLEYQIKNEVTNISKKQNITGNEYKFCYIKIRDNDTVTTQGAFYAFGGKDCAYLAMRVVTNVLRSSTRKGTVVFNFLDEVYRIKTNQKDVSNDDMAYGLFWSMYTYIKNEVLNRTIIDEDEIFEVSMAKKSVMDEDRARIFHYHKIDQQHDNGEKIIYLPGSQFWFFHHKREIDLSKIHTVKNEVQIGIMTALPIELAAVKAVMHNYKELPFNNKGAGHRYFITELRMKDGKNHKIAIGFCAKGTNAAAVRAALFKTHFPNLQTIIMTGIAGGVPNIENINEHVRLGDIVVSGEGGVVQYDYIKDNWQSKPIELFDQPRPPSAEILEAVKFLQADKIIGIKPWETYIEDVIEKLSYFARPDGSTDILYSCTQDNQKLNHPVDPNRNNKPYVFEGTIGSSNTLLKNPEKRDELGRQRNVKAIEMEGSGIAEATWTAEIQYFIVRGICDYCDTHKNKVWQPYAALAAAAYTRSLIETLYHKK